MGNNNSSNSNNSNNSNNAKNTNTNDRIHGVAPVVKILRSNTGSDSPAMVLRYQHHSNTLPQDMCYDGDGYYLNNHGEIKQCSWLINSRHDVTDETRRIQNCGYPQSAYPEATDLGKMCRDTCGTC